jgi:hypothetical protein
MGQVVVYQQTTCPHFMASADGQGMRFFPPLNTSIIMNLF